MDAINKLLGIDASATNGVNVAAIKGRTSSRKATETTRQAPSRFGRTPGMSARTSTVGKPATKSTSALNSKGKTGSALRTDMGKQDSNKLSLSEHPKIMDEASLKASHTPGRKGGSFPLPFGAKIIVPELCFGKKDSLSCTVASPDTRWLTGPAHLPSYELVNSEIYTLKSSLQNIKKNLIVQIPFKPVDSEFDEINVKGKWTNEGEWINVGFLIKELDGRPCVELELSRLGTFLVTITPKTENFDVTTQGVLYQARLSKHITVRFPKKAIDQNIQCALQFEPTNLLHQIHPIPSEQIQLTRDLYPVETADVTCVTEFVDVLSNIQCKFRRAATVKLPLPFGVELEVEGGGDAATSEGHPDIAVLCKSSMGWDLVPTPYRFTRTTVTFDTKELTRFCVVQCVADRQKKMKDAISLIEGRTNKDKGELCLFLSLKNKSWQGVIEVLPKKLEERKISDRKAQGFQVVMKAQAPVVETTPVRFSSRRPPPPSRTSNKFGAKEKNDSFEVYEGLTWLVDLDGDVKVSQGSDLRENNQLRFYSRLQESYRSFLFEPMDSEPKALEGTLNLIPVGIRDEPSRNRMSFTFKIEIEESMVVEYLTPETVPEEIEPAKPKDLGLDLTMTTPAPAKVATPPSTPKFREIPDTVMKRLTQSNRPVRVPERESRALTGKSLMTLARLIPEGLTLAVHLQLPDSTITGIGFDALSNHMNMSDVSYKILLYWKRKCKDKQMGAIKQLTEALHEMNYHVIADAILDCHKHHKEFTPDCVSHDEIFSRVIAG